jgi:hypothetical protein
VSRLSAVRSRLVLSDDLSDYRFSYIHSIAYAAERVATKEAGAVAWELLCDPNLSNEVLPRGRDPRLTADPARERRAYLALCLSRAVARCGDKRGYQKLVDFLSDQRLYLSRSARMELAMLTSIDHGFDSVAWNRWLEKQADSLPCIPFDLLVD